MKRKIRRAPFVWLGVVLVIALASQPACRRGGESEKGSAEDVAAIRAVLDSQAAAWNRGDIEGYMDGYERADETTFISGNTVTRGWQTVHDRYKKSYDTREKMGTLAFSELEIKPLSEFYANVTGRWQLTRAKDTPQGRFALIFRRTSAGWRIAQDTTTSAD
ncbi:MAG TPA: nuclear transport factor 2 family protein [Pyrinomonadaceae bacterium]|nr:nuclear transport factor 2 family protein [Pyrinomonadaceae bacterium]